MGESPYIYGQNVKLKEKFFFCMMSYVRKIEFQGEPDYKFLKKLLQLCCQRLSTKIDWRFKWQTQPPTINTIKDNKIYQIRNLA